MAGFPSIPEAIAELELVLDAIRSPGNRYLSRTVIDIEITEHPIRYPRLARMSHAFRKRFITAFMNPRFPVWGGDRASNKLGYVWVVDSGSGVVV